MKSASASAPVHKWRLSRTLRRTTHYRPIELDDVKYLWAAYKQGGLPDMGFEEGLSPEEFKEKFTSAVLNNCHAAWVLFGQTKKDRPLGIVLASWGPLSTYLVVIGAAWMPWATKRNIIECMVGFLSNVRKEHALQFYTTQEHKRLYEICAMHGVVRRVGTSYASIPGKAACVFETRAA